MVKCKKIRKFSKEKYTIGEYVIQSYSNYVDDGIEYHIDIRNTRNNYRRSFINFTLPFARKKLYHIIKELRRAHFNS